MGLRILLAGESWTIHSIHVKGFDTFTTSTYGEGVRWLREAFEQAGHDFTYIPGQNVQNAFPTTLEQLKAYDVVIISDIGANSFLLSDDNFVRSLKTPNRLKLVHDYVQAGGSLLMIGGYFSFQGIDGKARYQGTPVEQCLPVLMRNVDDRVEIPEGAMPVIKMADHPILQGLNMEWPHVLGYNQFALKEGAECIMSIGDDPFLCVQSYGAGRSAAFASDCSPHWAPPEFVNWKGYPVFWNNLANWLAGK